MLEHSFDLIFAFDEIVALGRWEGEEERGTSMERLAGEGRGGEGEEEGGTSVERLAEEGRGGEGEEEGGTSMERLAEEGRGGEGERRGRGSDGRHGETGAITLTCTVLLACCTRQ